MNGYRKYLPVLLFGLGLAILALLVLPLVHEFLSLSFGHELNRLSEQEWLTNFTNSLPLSPVHTNLVIQSLSQIEPQGLVLSGDFGDFLHQLWPTIFLNPELVTTSTWISAVVKPENSLLARLLARGLTEVVLAYLGFLIFRMGRGRSSHLSGLGLFLTLESLLAILRLPLSGQALEDMGLGFVVGPQIPGNIGLYNFLVFSFSPIFSYLILLLLAFWPWLSKPRPSRAPRSLAALLLLSFFPTYFGVIPQNANFGLTKVGENLATTRVEPMIEEEATLPPPPVVKATKVEIIGSGPSPQTVTIAKKEGDQFQLLINDVPTAVRGVHYYFGPLLSQPEPEKERALRRDLSIIQQMGFTAIMGWEEEGFDQRFLALAQEYDLKVIKPFLLKANGSTDYLWVDKNFLDQNLRSIIKAEFREKVERDKNSPSILFWNVGADEPLERIHSYYRRDERLIYDEKFKAQVDAQRQAAADLILELAEMIHQIDPRHPVIVSEPRYWHWPFYQEAIRKVRLTGVDPSHFFIYGGNFYFEPRWRAEFQRVKEETNAAKIMAAVTEWAPFGVDRKERPFSRARMSQGVMEATPVSIAYVFNPASDPIIGMPDPTQAIVSGFSLTDMERSDANGLLAALASTLERPFFPAALQILKADRERGFSGVPVSHPLPHERGFEQYFVGRGGDGKVVAYRWRLSERTEALTGPQVIEELFFDDGKTTIRLTGAFLQTYLEQGGLKRFGYPLGNAYQTSTDGQSFLRQDFSQGWSLEMKLPN